MFTYLSSMIKFRKNCYPKNVQDLLFTGFALIMIPVVFWFEIFVVLPKTYANSNSPFWPVIHTGLGTFILINVIGNLMALILIDTSISGVILQPKSDWQLCAECETLVPPRSWHCRDCNVCILKRDHHCAFCSNCIGYLNQRYFIHFLIYILIATTYSSAFNIFFVYQLSDFNSWMAFFSVIFPLAMLFFDYSIKQVYMLITLIVFLMCFYSGALLFFHMKLLLRGVVVHERGGGDVYNMGRIENLKEVFGSAWKVAWVSPLIKSPLPGDGQSFRTARKAQ